MDASRILGSEISAARVSSTPLAARTQEAPKSGSSFADHMKAALVSANQDLNTADVRAAEMATDEGDIVETMTALSRAELSLRHVVTLRNRVLESYQQIMRLQL